MKKNFLKRTLISAVAVTLLTTTLIPETITAYAKEPTKKMTNTKVEQEFKAFLEKAGIDTEGLDINKSLTDEQAEKFVTFAQAEAKKHPNKTAIPENRASDFDKSITRLTVKMKDTDKGTFITSFTPFNDAKDPYVGDAIGYAKLPLEGIIPFGWDPLGGKAIKDYRKGNYGARILVKFPEGINAKEGFKIVDWEKSILNTNLYVTVGIPTPVELKFPLKFDRSSVRFGENPNELSMVVRGMDKSQVSESEWESYPQALNESSIRLAATTNLGKLSGTAEGNLYLNVSQYPGNTDDTSKDKVLTKGKLPPSKTRKIEVQLFVIDRGGLVAGGAGAGNISEAQVIPGKEYINKSENNQIDTWREYISLWDNKDKFNTVLSANQEVTGEAYELPGKSIFDRTLNVNLFKDGDYNQFEANRFDRIVDYYTHENVTAGGVNDISSISLTHTPQTIPYNKETEVKYSGSVTTHDGKKTNLSSAVLRTTVNTEVPDLSFTGNQPDRIQTGQPLNLTGNFNGKTSDNFVIHYKVDNREWAQLDKYSAIPGEDVDWNATISGLSKGKHQIQVKAVDSFGKDSNILNHQVTVADEIDAYLTANDYKISPSNQYVTGTHSKNVEKIKLFVNGADRMTAAANNNGEGQYKIYAYDYIKNASDNVVVKALDKDGKVIKETKVNVEKEESVQTYLTANNYKIAPNSQYVSGTHSTDVDKIKLFVNGVDRMTAGANNNGAQGQYRIYAYDFIKSTSDNVVVKALSKNGQVIKETKVNITQDTGSITASNFKISTDELINGTFTGNIAVVKLYVDGVARNQVRPTGSNYSLYAAGYVTSASQNVVVTGFDANGIQVASQKVNVSN
ncbi:immunoglobulin-like domain-containing protein [Listeria newyorkensis]|uniref:Bacterial Ig domain-containing protein n=1 Tax=Listeria newyorkensis TaxID=1497681 RepID=A0A841YYW0_9LIST|nr:immunoglobulin-like domain-containing protein [Listeria newyorkensis]MBC1457813.1 hypothetical protein [Listeria newyorkensis]